MIEPGVGDEKTLTFAPIDRSARLVDKVLEALNESIVSGQLAAGTRLPSERELCDQFGVSRPVVREAIGSLNAKGLISSTPNRGHVVTPLGRERVTESLTLYLRGQQLEYQQLMEVRRLIEVENAGLAAERVTDGQLSELDRLLRGMRELDDPHQLSQADVEFHAAIAAATGNDFLRVMIESIREVLLVSQLPALADEELVARMHRGHGRIVRAIIRRDGQAAREAMRRHLRSAEQGMRRTTARSTPPAGS